MSNKRSWQDILKILKATHLPPPPENVSNTVSDGERYDMQSLTTLDYIDSILNKAKPENQADVRSHLKHQAHKIRFEEAVKRGVVVRFPGTQDTRTVSIEDLKPGWAIDMSPDRILREGGRATLNGVLCVEVVRFSQQEEPEPVATPPEKAQDERTPEQRKPLTGKMHKWVTDDSISLMLRFRCEWCGSMVEVSRHQQPIERAAVDALAAFTQLAEKSCKRQRRS